MLTIFHANPARLEGGRFLVDRKFHTGMQEYLKRLDCPLLTVHPELPAGHESLVMDPVSLPEAELGYRVITARVDGAGHALPADLERLSEAVRASRLVYGGRTEALRLAQRHGVPIVGVLEYNLRTTIVFACGDGGGVLRRLRKRAGAIRYYLRELLPIMRNAALLHCNGYPIFEESARFNPRRLLYLDSRMSGDMVIPLEALRARLAHRRRRIPRLIFSGRFEPAKGALDAVRVGLECARAGLEFELHLYGQGAQRAAMERLVESQGAGSSIRVHAPIPYPELMERSREFDLFVCCHVQDDPSCTYLEAMGCGLPIAGYGNAMWRSMNRHARAGIVTPLRRPAELAAAVVRLLGAPDELDALSLQARGFALEHAFEREFELRTTSLARMYAGAQAGA
ncbi:MAG: glycosyltransferase [Planctomycetes bacterium]|nr:glycosyltransferase [Planctomycetota bacterium]